MIFFKNESPNYQIKFQKKLQKVQIRQFFKFCISLLNSGHLDKMAINFNHILIMGFVNRFYFTDKVIKDLN